MGTKINVGSEIESKLGKDTEINIASKFGTKSQSWLSGSYSQSSSISLKLKLLIGPRIVIGQVQIGV